MAPEDQRSRRIGKNLLALFAVALTILLLGVALLLQFIPGKGSAKRADRWIKRFELVTDPDEAAVTFENVVIKRFHGGRWLFGICEDSHASISGGTLVTKDDSGEVRAFFGHVCGDEYLNNLLRLVMESPDQFYEHLLGIADFEEYNPDSASPDA